MDPHPLRKKVVANANETSPPNRATKRGIPSLYPITDPERKRIYMELWKISSNHYDAARMTSCASSVFSHLQLAKHPDQWQVRKMPAHAWKLKNRTLEWQDRPLIMGVLNVTPDSFSDGGRYLDPEQALDRALELEAEGADILDLGGESTRPGADPVSAEVEMARILPVLKRLQGRLAIPLSIDTWKSSVAVAALNEGAEIVNDVSAGRWDHLLWSAVSHHAAGYVLMHALDRPATMQKEPQYLDVSAEIADFLGKYLARAEENGLALESIVCDPGFGFGKTMTHNLSLLRDLEAFKVLHRPILVGLSRKSFLKLIGGSVPLEITNELAHVWASARGAAIWRVHDVPAAFRSARLAGAFGRGTDTV
jgi:dihydropteroate synthase